LLWYISYSFPDRAVFLVDKASPSLLWANTLTSDRSGPVLCTPLCLYKAISFCPTHNFLKNIT